MPEAKAPDQKLAPKSLLRHRPIGEQTDSQDTEGTMPFVPAAQRTSRPSSQTSRGNASTCKPEASTQPIHHRSLPHQTLSQTPSSPRLRKTRTSVHPPHSRGGTGRTVVQVHPLLLLGLGMLSVLVLWTLISTVSGWVRITSDDLRYGRPRTFQIDAWVGHNEQAGQPSHFIVLNLHRRVDIIEIQGGDPAHTRIYPGPQLYGSQDDLTPATLSFVTPPGKKYPNMILHIGTTQLTYLNTGQTFVPQ